MKKKNFILYLLLATLVNIAAGCSGDDENKGNGAAEPSATGMWTDERDGSEYGWVRYGSMEWTTSNLRYKPVTGTVQPDTTPVETGMYDDGVASRYYASFGYLYDYEAAVAAVPEGWRLPTADDWRRLEQICGKDVARAVSLSYGGYYLNDDYYQQLYNVDHFTYVYGFYWTATVDSSKTGDSFAFYRKITYNKAGTVSDSMDKTNYLSVRLVRDVR